jgi:CHASE2 domain-containing sensor protein/signal transduction histidine kinase
MVVLRLSQWRPAGLWIACVALAIIWLASLLGAFAAINAWAYRQYHGLNPFGRPEPKVTLIEADIERLPLAEWQRLLGQLSSLKPSAIGLLKRPAQWDMLSAGLDTTLIAKTVVPVIPMQGSGALALPPSQQPADMGWHKPGVDTDQGHFLSLEVAVAAQALGEPAAPSPFLIDFRPGANYLPMLDSKRVLAGDLTAELVRDKVVLIGRPIDASNPPLLTPLPTETEVSRLAYAGYAVDTLLHGRPVQPMVWWQSLILSLLIVGAAALLYNRLGLKRAPGIALSGSLLLFGIGWLSLQLFGLVMPVAELVALHLFLWYLLARHEQQRDWETLGQLFRSQSTHLHHRLQTRDFNTSEDPWGQVLLFSTQLLSLERAILLELEPGARHVREVKAYRCSMEDISERRRDFGRTPYSTAIAEGGPILLDQVYLKDPKPEHRQFIAPLEFNGQLLGFISGEVANDALERNPLFLRLLADCAEQIGELLYRRNLWQARQRSEAKEWRRLLQLDSVRAEYQSLTQVSRLFERRLELLERVFAHLETGTVLYDLFGQVSQVNHAMEDLARRADLQIFSLSASDMLATLCDMPLIRAREHLQYMLLTRESLHFSAQLPGVEGSFMLDVRPLQAAEASSQVQGNDLFRIQGFLLELVDVTHLVQLSQLKDELSNKVNAELRNQLESALLAAELCTQPDVSVEDKAGFQALVNRKLEQMIRTIGCSQQMLQAVGDVSQLTDFPINARTLLQDTARRWSKRLSDAGLAVKLETPTFIAFVRVDVALIAPTLDALMRVLAEDSSVGSVVRLSLHERQQQDTLWVFIRLENSGYGIPEERLQALLNGTSSAPTPAFHRMRQAVEQIGLWGGVVSAHSSLGRGICFEIRLPGTHFSNELHN